MKDKRDSMKERDQRGENDGKRETAEIVFGIAFREKRLEFRGLPANSELIKKSKKLVFICPVKHPVRLTVNW